MKKKLLIAVAILAILGFAAFRILYKEHRDISTEDATFTMTVAKLQQEFIEDGNNANLKYADKTIQIQGNVTSLDAAGNSLLVDEKLSAVLKEKLPASLQAGVMITLKGRFVGYDDLLEELKMDQVSIIK